MEIIDGYLHCGLRKFKPIEDVQNVLSDVAVARAVIVQHLDEYDNSYIGGIIRANPSRFAGTGLVDHTSKDACSALNHLHSSGFKGVRLTVDTLETRSDIWDVAAELGMIIVLYAPKGVASSVSLLQMFLDRHPRCKLVLTHLGNPDIEEAPRFARYATVFKLAAYPNIYYQISGMKMFCPYPHEELYPLVAGAVEAFGTTRVIWGSNYPVVGNERDYISDLRLLLDGRLPLLDGAIPAVAGANARKLWFDK
ncbi:MAG: amidohydrolase [Armatimonadetes bacterium]|nr:amidohydrolase [Armatimonadota bacterium]